jgi:hypothetical protein
MNLREMAEKIIRDAQKPLSPVEIWEIAEPQGYKEKLNLKGRTIPSTIGALMIQTTPMILKFYWMHAKKIFWILR